MMPSSVVDNSLAIGYAIPGVRHIDLKIDQENKYIEYDVKIEPKYYRKYLWVNSLSKGGIFKKIIALILVSSFNAPKPNIYVDYIESNMRVYLPTFKVKVNVGK